MTPIRLDVDFYPIVESYFKEKSFVDVQIESYNQFVDKGLQEVIDNNRVVELGQNLRIEFGKLKILPPSIVEADGSRRTVTPMECRQRKLTYEAPMYLEAFLYDGNVEIKRQEVFIGSLPVMVKSKICVLHGLSREELIKAKEDPLDPGGYFIINGSERVVVSREDIASNRVIVSKGTTSPLVAKVYSVRAGYRAVLTLQYKRNGEIIAQFAGVNIPVTILLRALGLETDRDITYAISSDRKVIEEFLVCLDAMPKKKGGFTVEDALDFIGRRLSPGSPREERIVFTQNRIERQLLPHIGTRRADNLKKAYYIAKMVERLIRVKLKEIPPDDKDHYKNKRIQFVGDLLQTLFRYAFVIFAWQLQFQISKKISKGLGDIDIRHFAQPQTITDRFHSALATGSWVGGATGVSQILDRTNYLATISHLRRVISPLTRTHPHFKARALHPTTWGRLCPLETPEGTSCGLVKGLASFIDATVGVDKEPIITRCIQLGVIPIERATPEMVGKLTPVYVDGLLIGLVEEPEEFIKRFNQVRREISHEINSIYDREKGEVVINADAGRIRRILIPVNRIKDAIELLDDVKNGRITFSGLVKRGIIEFLDALEEEEAIVATNLREITPKHTHLDFAPYMMFGVAAGMLPYAEHNQSARDVIAANITRQGLGMYAVNWHQRMDSRAHILYYPQRPIVATRVGKLLGYDNRPSGQNLVVAVLCMDNYNTKDAVVLNKGAVDRGVARSVFFRTYEAVERRYFGGQEDRFEIPSEEEISGRRTKEAYRNLGPDGIAEPEQEVKGGDVIIGRTSPPRFIGEYLGFREAGWIARKDTSIGIRYGERGIITTSMIANTGEGDRIARVVVRDSRIPELGDKFATRHGQKGVVGMIYRHDDMPFTYEGIVPDLVLNPHAIPSRMTVGQLIELLAGKVGCLEGRIIDGTPFISEPVEDLKKALVKLGFRYDGREVMYDGMTGEMLAQDIFIGVCFYQKLKHMVRNKIHARARGQVQILTRQPVEGRAKGGGLRIGEMEEEVFIAYGASALIQDRLLDNSDKTVIFVCKNCGRIAYYDRRKRVYVCEECKSPNVVPVVTAYAMKLLIQEMISAGIDVRLEVERL